MAIFTKALLSSQPSHSQGTWVSSACLSDEFRGKFFHVKKLVCADRKASIGWHAVEETGRGHRLLVYFATAVVSEETQIETDLQKAKPKRGRPKKTTVGVGTETSSRKNTTKKTVGVQTEEKTHAVCETREGHLFKYSEVVPEISFQQFEDEEGVSSALVTHIVQLSKESIDSRGWFTIALSGGSLVKTLGKLADEALIHGIDWSKWHVFWVDERVVPLTHGDSNYKLAMETFLSKVNLPTDQIHAVQYSRNASVVAGRYTYLIRKLARKQIVSLDTTKKFPCFDMILLGIGPDGHVASLFPNSLAVAEEKQWVVAVLNSPKPPPERITLTLPCINSASHIAFVVIGSNKAEILQRVLERPALPGALPAQLVRPSNGILSWFVDNEATGKLSIDAWGDPKQFPTVKFSPAKITQTD